MEGLFLELIKKNIHMDRVGSRATTQITLEEDMNVPDSKPDVSSLIYDRGELKIEEIRPSEDHVLVKGNFLFHILYQTKENERPLASVKGSIPVEEQVFMEGATVADQIEADWELEDLTCGIINSRKLSIQALLTLRLIRRDLYDEEAAVEIYAEEPIEYRKMAVEMVQTAIKKNDIFRIREEISLPGNYPNIFEIIWDGITISDIEFKPLSEKISVQGDIHAFILYEGEGEEQQVRSFETIIPFSQTMDCNGCSERMISDIRYHIGHLEVDVRSDLDGEERIIGLEMVLELAICLYEEEQVDVLADVYGVTKEITAVTNPVEIKQLLMRGSGKCKVNGRVKVKSDEDRIFQVIHSEGSVMVDEKEVTAEGIEISGELFVRVLYVTGEDTAPYRTLEERISFHYLLETPPVTDSDTMVIHPQLEQLSVSMLDGEEMDVKALLNFQAVIFKSLVKDMITDIESRELDQEVLANLPGIAIYVVKKNDNLWNIGKKYYVSVAGIKEMNQMATDDIKEGDKLLIVKGVKTG